MAKIKRNTPSRSPDPGLTPKKRSIIPDGIRRYIPFLRPAGPIVVSGVQEVEAGSETTAEPENTATTASTSSSATTTGTTDPGNSTSTSTTSSDMEPMLGEIRLFAGNFAPRGWAFCDGQLLNVSEHTALFSILGIAYGGDGRTNFKLPQLQPYQGVKHIIAMEGVYPARS